MLTNWYFFSKKLERSNVKVKETLGKIKTNIFKRERERKKTKT